MAHWVEQYIGKPWGNGEQGPAAFDCWGLCRYVWCTHFGIVVPIIQVDADDLLAVVRNFSGNPERERWRPVTEPRDGDAVLFSRSIRKPPVHVGVVTAGRVLHCQQGVGVVFQAIPMLRRHWGRIDFYRHAQ